MGVRKCLWVGQKPEFKSFPMVYDNTILASCPWGLVTASGVDLLTENNVIYVETHTIGCCRRGED